AVGHNDLLDRPLHGKPGPVVRFEEAALDAEPRDVLAGRTGAQEPQAVAEAVAKGTARHEEVVRSVLDGYAVGLLIGFRQSAAVAVDDQIPKHDALAVVA